MREENQREPNTQLLKGFLLHKGEGKKEGGKVVEKGSGVGKAFEESLFIGILFKLQAAILSIN